MSGHRSDINHNATVILYQHFDQPGHSIVSMKIHITKKITVTTQSMHMLDEFKILKEAIKDNIAEKTQNGLRTTN